MTAFTFEGCVLVTLYHACVPRTRKVVSARWGVETEELGALSLIPGESRGGGRVLQGLGSCIML